MSKAGNARTRGRRTPSRTDARRTSAHKLRSARSEEELLNLVRARVESFILNKTTVEHFIKTIREVTETEQIYSHQLTKSVFSKIVKDAIRKRNLGRSR